MDTQYYEDMLSRHSGSGHNAEAAWDSRANSYGAEHPLSGMDVAAQVTRLLLEKGLLRDMDVLDIGGGTGRYAVPFAAHAREVTVVDISGQMLERTRENALRAGRSNLRCEKLNWEEADLTAAGWERRFDLTFASMCPAVRSKAGIDKMSRASRGWCQINQLIEMTDTISHRLVRELKPEARYDPHNDRDSVQATFHLLWLQGFAPEITYLREAGRQVLSVEEAVLRYTRRFGQTAEARGADLKRLLEECVEGGGIPVDSKTTLAMILWRA